MCDIVLRTLVLASLYCCGYSMETYLGLKNISGGIKAYEKHKQLE